MQAIQVLDLTLKVEGLESGHLLGSQGSCCSIPSFSYHPNYEGHIDGIISIGSGEPGVILQIDDKGISRLELTFAQDLFTKENLMIGILPFVNLLLNQTDRYILHSSAVSGSDKGILFLGESGSGKTTIALDLCEHAGFQLLSGDLSVIQSRPGEQPTIVGGTNEVLIKKVNAQYHSFNGAPYHDDYVLVSSPNPFPTINPPLSAIYLVKIDISAKELSSYEIKPRKAKILLSEALSTYIRASNILWIPERPVYYPSFDNEDLFTKRAVALDNLVASVPALYINGSLKKAKEYILGTLKSQ